MHDIDVLDGLMRTMRARRSASAAAAARRSPARSTPAPISVAARAVLAPASRVARCTQSHIGSSPPVTPTSTPPGCGRSARRFASASARSPRRCALMDEYPEYRFACSQAQQYAWIEETQPELFERIDVKVHGGQWIPVGGMWVEADMNLPSGESLARQIVLRPALLRVAVRSPLPRGVDPRRVRLPGVDCRSCTRRAACAASSPRSCRGTSTTASRTTRSGGRASTAHGC